MKIAGRYSFKSGAEVVASRYAAELREIEEVIAAVDSSTHKTKVSKEKTMPGKVLYKPSSLNQAFRCEFEPRDWHKFRVLCDYPTDFYIDDYTPGAPSRNAYREMDFIKNKLGVEVQFGKYAFMVYNVCAKMTIFNRMGLIDAGIEIVPVRAFAGDMSTGVSYFEQFVWDLQHRGTADIDIPVLILGVAA